MVLSWFLLALLAAPFFAASELVFKFSNCQQIDIRLYISFLWICFGIIGLLYTIYTKSYQREISKKNMVTIASIALLIFIGNILYWTSCKRVHNPGLSRSVFSGSFIVILVMASMFIFHKKITVQQGMGILIIIVGLVLMNIKLNIFKQLSNV